MHLKPLKTISADSSASLAATDDSSDEDESSNGEAKKRALPALSEEQLLLCASSVKGYSLRNKRWLDLFVDCIEDIEWNDAAWDNVVLEHDLKDLIISMTRGYRQRLQSTGLNILLSGCTGVGKTFTVESIAEALHAPLFHVTPEDVDLHAENPDLESPFTKTLEMCGRWNAFLLFDQAPGALNSDPLDDDQSRNYSCESSPSTPKRPLYPNHPSSVLLEALASHSAVFFMTCSLGDEDCMDDRLRSRFHVCLQLPWPTRASRAQIWQKCLGSHKDMSFFIDTNALADWDLNGREIANVATAAMTLVTDGVVQMKHLERVLHASKDPLSFIPSPPPPPPRVYDDLWELPPKKNKKGKKVSVDEIIKERPKSDDDTWAGRGFGAQKDKKKTVDAGQEPTLVPGFHDTLHPSEASKSGERTMPIPPPPPPGKTDAPKEDDADDWGGFGVQKGKKVKKAMAIDAELAKPSEEKPVADPSRDEWNWGFATPKKTKKSKKKAIAEDTPLFIEDPTAIPSCSPPLPFDGCPTSIEHEPVSQDCLCKRCGTQGGNSAMCCD